MSAAQQTTNLETPPEYRGQRAEAYCVEISRWAKKYHLMLNTLVRTQKQRMADVAAVVQLTQAIDNPPTQAQVQAIQAKVNEVINAAGGT